MSQSTEEYLAMARKMLIVNLSLEIDERTARLLGQYSVERMINTTLKVCEESEHEWAGVNHEDWTDWKRFVVSLWVNLSDAIFRVRNDIERKAEPYQLSGVE